MRTCEDCGTKLRSSGACPNCHEELVIFDEQIVEDPIPVSDGFAAKVKEQREEVRQRRREYRESL